MSIALVVVITGPSHLPWYPDQCQHTGVIQEPEQASSAATGTPCDMQEHSLLWECFFVRCQCGSVLCAFLHAL